MLRPPPMAVYTQISVAEAATFLEAYDSGEAQSLEGIRGGVSNTNYFLTTTRGRYVLTLYEKAVRTEDLPFFLALMEHLAAQGFPCPRPVPGWDGQALRQLAGKPAALVTFLEGRSPDVLTPALLAEAGTGLARLHRAAAGAPLVRPHRMGLEALRTLYENDRARADEVRPGLSALLGRELDWLRAHWPHGLPTGIIHADYFPDNVFFKDGRLSGVLDFYFAGEDFLAWDVALVLNAWCFERDTAFNVTKGRAFLRGYESERPLSPEEKTVLPVLARSVALRFLLTRLRDKLNPVPGAEVATLNPLAYVERLAFHQQVGSVSAYGLEP